MIDLVLKWLRGQSAKLLIVGSIPIQVSYMWTLAEWLTRLIVDQDFTSSNLVRPPIMVD